MIGKMTEKYQSQDHIPENLPVFTVRVDFHAMRQVIRFFLVITEKQPCLPAFLPARSGVPIGNFPVIRIQPQSRPRFPHTCQNNCENSRSDQLVYIRLYQRTTITMIAELFHRITTKIRSLGHTKKSALILVNGRIVVAMVMGLMRIKTCNYMTGLSTGYCGQVAAAQYYALFEIHR